MREIRAEKEDNYLNRLKKDFQKAIEAGMNVYCIMEKNKRMNGSWHNYAWSPMVPILRDTPGGKKINKDTAIISNKYLKEMDGWDFHYHEHRNDTGYKNEYPYNLEDSKNLLLKTSIGDALAFSLGWTYSHRRSIKRKSQQPIKFLPPAGKEGVDVLLSEITEEPKIKTPDWSGDILLPGEENTRKEIDELKQSIKEKEVKINKRQNNLDEIQNYKKLLFSTGESLEKIVYEAFDLIGISLKKPEVQGKEDALIKTKNTDIPVEVKGVKGEMKERYLNQLTGRFADKKTPEDYEVRGIFVLNHNRKKHPENRNMPFHPNIVEKAKPFNVCLISTKVIFRLVKKKMENKNSLQDIKNDILNNIGVFSLEKENG